MNKEQRRIIRGLIKPPLAQRLMPKECEALQQALKDSEELKLYRSLSGNPDILCLSNKEYDQLLIIKLSQKNAKIKNLQQELDRIKSISWGKTIEDIIWNCALKQHNGIDSIIVSEATMETRIAQAIHNKIKGKE